MTAQRIRVLLVDDHPLMVAGLLVTLNAEPDIEVVGSAATGAQALEQFRTVRPDVTVMDVGLTPEMTGIEAIAAIRRESPDARIIVISGRHEEDVIFRAQRAGAATYLLKEALSDNLAPIIREVHSGGGTISPEVARKLADGLLRSTLTPREIEVLKLVAEGFRNKEIAARLTITQQTVEFHIKNIFAKLGVNDRTRAATVAARRGTIDVHHD
jgi:DNA-binding NarL/FixJ family response regulator